MKSKRVDIDEYLNSRGYAGVKRKECALDSGVILKAMPAGLDDLMEKAGYNEQKRSMRFVMSAEVEDRDRDIVMQAGLDTRAFEKNPVAPWAHRSGELPVGSWSDLVKHLTGKGAKVRTEGTLTLTEGSGKADELHAHFKAGSVRACSIGFMPTEIERREVPEDMKDEFWYYPGYIIHAADLYECSPCTIPANPAALAKAAKEGDKLAMETLDMVLDKWEKRDGVIVPRKAFEDARRDATKDRTIVVIEGQKFRFPDSIKAGEPITLTPEPEAAPEEPADLAKAISSAMEKHSESFFEKLTKALGFKGGTADADPAPEQDGQKPAPLPTPEEKAAQELSQMDKVFDQIDRDVELIALDKQFAALQSEENSRAAA